MMRTTEKIGILCAFLLLLLMPATASVQKSVDDPQGDVKGMSGTVDMPDVDIKKVTYAQTDDGSVTITLQVYGSIDPDNSIYMVAFNTTNNGEETLYQVLYTKNEDLASSMSGGENGSTILATTEHASTIINGTFEILQGNILRIQFKLLNSSELPVNLTAIAAFMEISSQTSLKNFGMDYATMKFELPVAEENNNQQNNNQQNHENKDKKGGIPGFEAAFLIAAISIAILLRRKYYKH